MVPRIIYELCSCAAATRSAAARRHAACVRFFESPAADGSAPVAAFPDLAAYIVASIARRLFAHPAMWELLAGRACASLDAAVEKRAAAVRAAGGEAILWAAASAGPRPIFRRLKRPGGARAWLAGAER